MTIAAAQEATLTEIVKDLLNHIDSAACTQMEYYSDVRDIKRTLRAGRYEYQVDGAEPVAISNPARWLVENLEGIDPDELTRILILDPGESCNVGGGAGPMVTVRRTV